MRKWLFKILFPSIYEEIFYYGAQYIEEFDDNPEFYRGKRDLSVRLMRILDTGSQFKNGN